MLSGLRPNSTGAVQFIDHAKAPVCLPTEPKTNYMGNDLRSFNWLKSMGATSACCDACTREPQCSHWTYNFDKQVCFLKTSDEGRQAQNDTVSGPSGRAVPTVSIPQHLREHGYLTLGTGKSKTFHITMVECMATPVRLVSP